MGSLEELDAKVRSLMVESRDIYFTNYLRELQGRIINQKYQINLLEDELNKNIQIYRQRVQSMIVPPPAVPPQNVAAPRPVMPPQSAPAPRPAVPPQNVAAPQPVMPQQSAPAPQPVAPQAGVFSSSDPNSGNSQPAGVMREPVQTPQPQFQTPPGFQPQFQAPPQSATVSVPAYKPKTSVEFKVGAILLSIVGGIFVLSALVMLGMNFMNGMIKGMSLYAVSLLFLILAECVFYRRWQRLGVTISAISIGGLYLSTLINYLALKNINTWVALGIAVAVTLFVIGLSRKRDAVGYRFLGMFSCFVCLLAWKDGFTLAESLVVTAVILVLNLVCICVPVKKAGTGFFATYMSVHTIFSILFLWKAMRYHVPYEACAAFAVMSLFITHLIYIVWVKRQKKVATPGEEPDNIPCLITYGLCAFCYFWMIVETGTDLYTIQWLRHGVMAGIVFSIVLTLALLWKTEVKWAPWYLLNALVFMMYGVAFGEEATVYCLLGLLVCTKILALWKIPALRVNEAVVTAVCCLAGLLCYDKLYGMLLLAGLLFSILCITTWKTYYESIITFTIALSAAFYVPTILKLPLFTGILFIGILLFNNVKRLHGKGILVYNVLVLAGQTVCLLFLTNPVYRNAYITFLCMLVFGVATIVLTLQDKYHMEFKGKNLVLAVFLSYMAFIFKTSMPVLNSALLMVIALVCVGIGFVSQEKAVRIYGLVLSLLVCGKLVLHDYFGAPTLQKTIVFLVVGVIALIIAAIYMILEKKNSSRNGVE